MNETIDLLTAYCERLSTPPTPVLKELERETHLKTLAPQMMSGHLHGHLLRLLCRFTPPKWVLEIGTFTAYATICLAEGLPADGILHTIEANPEMAHIIEKYIQKAGIEDRVKSYTGKAEEIIPRLNQRFDFVFLDAGKLDYGMFYDLLIDQINPGGLILADNVLWSGKVVQSTKDKDTAALHAFNEKINQDPRVENIILPIRDGLLIAQKL